MKHAKLSLRSCPVHLAVAGDVLILSYFELSFFPRDVLDDIWNCIESVIESFPTYFFNKQSTFDQFI